MDFIVTSLIALGLVWVAVNSLVGVAMFFSPLSARSTWSGKPSSSRTIGPVFRTRLTEPVEPLTQ